MILGSSKIRERLEKKQIFRKDTWIDGSIKEASYALRVANDGMVVGGKMYEPGRGNYPNPFIEIEPGSIAILSTVEQLCMPCDLVGKLGIRLEFASKGLTGLMGMQVDPFYGQNHDNERLYIKVANFGNEPVRISPEAPVFNIEFSMVEGADNPKKPSTWTRIKDSLANQEHSDWTYMTKVNLDAQNIESRVTQRFASDVASVRQEVASDVARVRQRFTSDVESIRQGQQSVVMFGVFLVSITILGVMLGLIFSVDNPPNWVTQWGWIILMALFTIAVVAILIFVVTAGFAFYKATGGRKKRE